MFADVDHSYASSLLLLLFGNVATDIRSSFFRSHPDVSEEMIKWGVWILKEAGFDGFRFDAIKHIDESFIAKFCQEVRDRVENVRISSLSPSSFLFEVLI